MKKIKKIAIICFWILLVVGLITSLGFVNIEQEQTPCTAININVDQSNELYFLDNDDIKNLITERGYSIINSPKKMIDVTSIENALNSYFTIENAEVFMDINGTLSVNVKQRNPIIRIINKTGEEYYIDDKGKAMPLSEKYTAKVLIANGNINEPYALRYKYTATEIAKDSVLKNSLFDELYAISTYINKNDFWKAQIQQIFINDNNEIELIPLAGNHKIIFGDTALMDKKFEKLMIFYQEGLNTTGWWEKYSTINLKFKNQIVCTKKQ